MFEKNNFEKLILLMVKKYKLKKTILINDINYSIDKNQMQHYRQYGLNNYLNSNNRKRKRTFINNDNSNIINNSDNSNIINNSNNSNIINDSSNVNQLEEFENDIILN